MKLHVQEFRTITGKRIELEGLTEDERTFLAKVLDLYRGAPDWTDFAAQWGRLFDKHQLTDTSPVYRICQDLEARLGISQGRVAPPDYRDYLADLIESRFGSRHRFCEKTGVDRGHLSRVFSGRADLSLASLTQVLEELQAVLVIESKEEVTLNVSPEAAVKLLERAV